MMRAQLKSKAAKAGQDRAPSSPPARWPLSPAKDPIRPALRGGLVGGALVGIVVAALFGWALRDFTTSEPPPAPPAPKSAAAGPVTVTVDGEWTPAKSVPGLPGLDPSTTAVFSPASGLRAYAIATVAPIRDGSLLPPALRALLPARLPAAKKTELLGLSALQYPEQAIAGERRMEVTVVPTTAGALAVACVAPRESWVAALGCSAGVHQLALRGGAWLEPGDDLAFRERLPAVVHKLDARRVILRGKLRAAKTRRGQARFAKRLSRAYGNAAASLAPVLPAKGPAVQAVAAMQGSAAAHKDLAAAARNGWPQRYKRAKRSVKRKEAALARALAATR